MPITTRRTFCRFCHAACAIEVDVDTDTSRIVGVRGDAADPIFGAYTCTKGRHLPEQHHHPDRLRTALKRRPDGGFDAIPTEQALDEIAARFTRLADAHGPRTIATYCGTATFMNAAAHPVVQAFHRAIGSTSYYTSITIDQPAKMVTPLRLGSWNAGHQPFSTADVALVVGANVLVSMFGVPGGPTFVNPLASLRAARQRGQKLIVVDPRRTETAAMADLHLHIKPGEDPVLMAGLLRVILDEDRHDAAFCDRWVSGRSGLHRALRGFDLHDVAARTGIAADEIVTAARMFAAGPRGGAMCGTGPNMAPYGTLLESLVQTCNVVCGRFAREGERVQHPAGVLGLRPPGDGPKAQPNAPRPAMLSNGPKARVRDLHTILGQSPTAALADEILEPGEGQVRALVTVGGNPVLAWPDQARTIRALESLDTHVALDIRLSATARLAHYVIPSQLSLERPDVPTNVDTWFEDPYTIYTPAMVEPDAGLVDEAGLYVELARRMGVTLPLAGGELAPTDVVSPDELLERCYPHVRVPWPELRATEGAVLRDELTCVVQPADADCNARFDVAPDLVLDELAIVRDAPDGYGELAGYDPHVHTHRMTSRRLKSVFNSSGREIEALRAKEGTAYAHAHPDDLAQWGVQDGDVVEITSPRGSVRTLVKASPDVRPGTVSMAHAWGDLPGEAGPPADPAVLGDSTGRLSDCASGYDRVTGLPVMSAIPVAVRAV